MSSDAHGHGMAVFHPQVAGPGKDLTSSRHHYLNVPSPIRRGVLGRLHFQVFSAFHGLYPDFGGSALPAAETTVRTLAVPS